MSPNGIAHNLVEIGGHDDQTLEGLAEVGQRRADRRYQPVVPDRLLISGCGFGVEGVEFRGVTCV